MASAFSHIAVPLVLFAGFKSATVNFRLLLLAAIGSVIPDLDVIAFLWGISYESQWGHRGFTHSLVFALCLAGLMALFYRKLDSSASAVFWLCFISVASHAFLDAMTNGGLGVALFWPFSSERIFLPVRPIQVSPIGISGFFSEWGLRVIASELIWIWFPALVVGALGVVLRRLYTKK